LQISQKTFLSIPLDYTLKQNNKLVKDDDGVVGLTGKNYAASSMDVVWSRESKACTSIIMKV